MPELLPGELPDYTFTLRPAPHEKPLAERLATAVDAALSEGLRVERVTFTVDREGAFDSPTEVRVRRWLKRCGRDASLRAKWPERDVLHPTPHEATRGK